MNRKEICEHVGSLITGERNETHGDPFSQFETAQQIKRIIGRAKKSATLAKVYDGADALLPVELEALDMIITKISRLVNGLPIRDHWDDIIGYAAIAAEARQNEIDLQSVANKTAPKRHIPISVPTAADLPY